MRLTENIVIVVYFILITIQFHLHAKLYPFPSLLTLHISNVTI